MLEPIELLTLLYYSHHTEGHPNLAPSELDATQKMLLEADLIEPKDDSFTASERGEVFVKMLCKLRLPIAAWIDPNPDSRS